MIFSLWLANMDIQFIIDPHAMGAYVNDCLLKSNAAMSRLLREVQDQFKEGNLDLLKSFRHYINAFLNHSEISAQEVRLHLEGTDM